MFIKLKIKTIVSLFLISAFCLSLLLPITSNAANSAASSVTVSLASSLPVVIDPGFGQPPASFNPLTATSEELHQYGFPPKPFDVKDAVYWEYAMEHAKYWVKPIQIPSLARYGFEGQIFTGVGTPYNGWAGYVVRSQDNSNMQFYGSSAYWNQPSYANGLNGEPTWTAFWTGIGGGSTANGTTGDIIQAGATSDATAYGGSEPYEFWVQNYYPNGPGAMYEAAPALKAGDWVETFVDYNGNGTSLAFLEDVSTDQYTQFNFNTPYYDGSSQESVNEEASYSNWGSVQFIDSDYYTYQSGGFPFANINYWRYIIGEMPPGITWSVPTYPPGSNSFTVNSTYSNP